MGFHRAERQAEQGRRFFVGTLLQIIELEHPLVVFGQGGQAACNVIHRSRLQNVRRGQRRGQLLRFRSVERHRLTAGSALQLRQAGVARDGVDPGGERGRAVVGGQRFPNPEESFLGEIGGGGVVARQTESEMEDLFLEPIHDPLERVAHPPGGEKFLDVGFVGHRFRHAGRAALASMVILLRRAKCFKDLSKTC